MVVAASRDGSMTVGGTGFGEQAPTGEVYVKPMAWLTQSGKWKAIPCDEHHPEECVSFDKEYLKQPHTYTVVSADGRGAKVQVKKMSLDSECFGYGGSGTFSGDSISNSAVATSSTEFFATGESARRLADRDAKQVSRAFAAAVGKKLDSIKKLRVYSLRLEGHDLFVV